MTEWIWTEFVPEDPSCGCKAFECDLDWEDDELMAECARRIADLSERFGTPAQGHVYTDTGPFDDGDYDHHRWFFNLEEQYTAYSKRFEFQDGEMQEALNYGNLDAITLSVFFREPVTRQEFGLDLG
ncbi:hypothetical protein GN316_03810 [Xylophilus sp. Kf1]|nr:hypothetical protein [Xylophilus sp. Kf1]